MPDSRTLLIMTQVYLPDPAAVGQHIADAAERMVERGWRVIVYTSRRGYDDPTRIFPRIETRQGVEIRRLPLSSFGKASIPVRLAAQAIFLSQATLRALFARRVDAVLVSTSPPFAGVGGWLLAKVRGARLIWWVMDINPDQMVTSGRLSPTSAVARVFDAMNRLTLRAADGIIVLDRFMRERMLAKLAVPQKISVIGPWAHEDRLETVRHADNPFRREHGLDGKFVVMYSGNHGFSTPLATLLEAAKRLVAQPGLVFVFIGGGVIKKEIDAMIEREHPANIVSLPYQPIESIRYSLSAADVHAVSIANEAVGVIHPCKIYGAMAVGRPILALGPRRSHAGELVEREQIGWACEHRDVDRLVETLRHLLELPRSELEAMGSRAKAALSEHYSRQMSLDAVCDLVEGGKPATCTVATT
jgi:colanic acid biosynthesis glycosyl transferase WcaI